MSSSKCENKKHEYIDCDIAGSLTSTLCLLHCLLPIMFSWMAVTSSIFSNHFFELLFWGFALFFAYKSIFIKKTNNQLIKIIFSLSAITIISSFIFGHWLAIIASSFLILAHILSFIEKHGALKWKSLK